MRAPRDFLISGFCCADSGCVNYLLKLCIDKLIEGKKKTGEGGACLSHPMWNRKRLEKYRLFSILLLCSCEFVKWMLWDHKSIPIEKKGMIPFGITVRTTTFLYFFFKPFVAFLKPKPGAFMHICIYVSICKYLCKDFFLLEVFYENRNRYTEFFGFVFLNWEGKDAKFY